jgi:phospho-N-acetylmuramoyl-pentapeptide-transferase
MIDIALRCTFAAISSFAICLLLGPVIISFIKRKQLGQIVRSDGPTSHLKKQGTPTMGGLLILLSIFVATLAWCDMHNIFVQILLLTLCLFGFIGGIDDWQKIAYKNSAGLSAKLKIILQLIAGIIIMLVLNNSINDVSKTQLILPVVKNFTIDLGWFFVPFSLLVIIGSSNAVNLTDGLDGLAIMPIVLVACGFGVFAFISGSLDLSKYFTLPYLPNIQEIVVLISIVVGAGLGFLWFNAYPAQIFMGDVGSLSLGAFLGVLAVLLRQEILLVVMGFVFVCEALSVILQVVFYKLYGRRVFKMAPLHHHFELNGVSESKVIVRFWIVTLILVLLGLATLQVK